MDGAPMKCGLPTAGVLSLPSNKRSLDGQRPITNRRVLAQSRDSPLRLPTARQNTDIVVGWWTTRRSDLADGRFFKLIDDQREKPI